MGTIKINNQSIAKLYLGNIAVKRAYSNGSIVYDTGVQPTPQPCFEVVETITDATGNFVDVYTTDTEKWYKRNNLNQYEEYGIMPSVADLSTLTYYVGKLAICTTDAHEYKWNGTQWVDLGSAGQTAIFLDPSNSSSDRYSYPVEYYFGTGYKLRSLLYLTGTFSGDTSGIFNSHEHSPIKVSFYSNGYYFDSHYPTSTTAPETTNPSYSNRVMRTGVFNSDSYKNRCMIMEVQMNKIAFYDYNTGDVLTDLGGGSVATITGWYDGLYPTFYSPNATNPVHAAYFQVIDNNGNVVNDIRPVLNNGEIVLHDSIINVDYSNTGGNVKYHTEIIGIVPVEDYDTKLPPANNVHYNTLAELELMECPWNGMQATIGENYDLYFYWNNQWNPIGSPCFEVVSSLSEASGEYIDVYDKTSSIWYKKNNLNEYEEYGLLPTVDSLSNVTYYVGKMILLSTDLHEYKWNGSQWVDLGAATDVYMKYEYMTCNGTSYIITDYIPKDNTAAEIDIQGLTGGYQVFGALNYWSSNGSAAKRLRIQSSNSNSLRYDRGANAVYVNQSGLSNRLYLRNDSTGGYLNGTKIATFSSSTEITGCKAPLGICTAVCYDFDTSRIILQPGISHYNGKIYSMKIYEGNTLVRNFVPAIKDNVAGLYDTVNKVLWDSEVSTQFTVGGSSEQQGTVPEDYDTKVAPPDDVHYNTLVELMISECPWIGMTATVGDDYTVYVYTEDGWVLGDVPLDLPYLRFTALEDTTFTFTKANLAASDLEVKYSIDGGSWKTMESGVATTTVQAGSYVVLKSNFKGYNTVDFMANGRFSSTGKFNLSGNIMSLIYGDEFVGQTSLANYKCVFGDLFYNCTKLKSISSELLPATTLSISCYYGMFSSCTGLTSIPENLLQATTLDERCYKNMFNGCTGITSIPSNFLPATNLSNQCYTGMFQSSGVKSIPSGLLHSTNLASNCYANMFTSSNVNSIPSNLLPATTLASNCYYRLFSQTRITSVPDGLLPATNLADYCYQEMFYGCTRLKSANIELPATTVNKNMAYYSMFYNCTNLLEPPIIKATSVSGNKPFGYMFYGCTKIKYLVCDMLNEPSSSISQGWLSGVAATGTFYKNPNATWDQTITKGVDTVPTGWNIVSSDTEPNYLTFTVVDPNGSTFRIGYSGDSTTEYSIDNGSWTTLSGGVNSPLVQENSSIRFRGTITHTGNASQRLQIYSSGKFNVSGNILTLLYGANYREGQISKADKSYIFYRMFYNNTNVVDAGNLILPVFETAPTSGFQDMFRGCTSLTTSPVMKANNTGQYAFRDVFNGCSSLTTVNEVYCGNTNVESHVCMFANCTSLVNVPNINVTTSYGWSVQWMFQGCTNLQSIVLKGNWGYSSSAQYVFNFCTSLISVTYLGSTKPESSPTTGWLRDVPANGTFYMSNQYSWDSTVSRDANGVPASWTIVKIDPSSV